MGVERRGGPMDLSIVVPLYNEQENIPLLYRDLKAVCDRLNRACEIIFVDDGSTDGTERLLTELHRDDPAVRVVRFRKNYGQTAAMAAGFEAARGKAIISMDGDLQNDPADFPHLLAKLNEGYDVVCGWRKNRMDKFFNRRFPSVVANWIMGRITGVRIHDNGCSLKAFRTPVIKNLVLYGEMHRFIPALFLLTGARITEIAVNHHPRRFGKSKYGIGRVWRVMLDMITVKMITSFSSRPAVWFGLLSVPFIIGGLLTLLAAVDMNLRHWTEGWMVLSTTAWLFLYLSLHLLVMGILGELTLKTGDFVPRKGLEPTLTRHE